MTVPHLLLALGTVMAWGLNYVAIGWGVRDVPPMLLAALRFTCAAVPLVLVVPRPRLPFRRLARSTLTMFVLQFGLLFTGIRLGLPAGLSSLVTQVQVFMTMGIATGFMGERPRAGQWAGAAIAFAGIALVGLNMNSRTSLAGFGLALAAAQAWSLANLVTKRMGPVDPLALVAWCSLFSVPVLLGASMVLEGPGALRWFWLHCTWATVGSILFQAYGATLFGFTAWCFLLRRYPASLVAPMSMLVPVFGMAGGAAVLGEPLTAWKAAAATLVLAGSALNQWAANGKGKGESFCNVCCKIHPGPADEAGGTKMTLGQE